MLTSTLCKVASCKQWVWDLMQLQGDLSNTNIALAEKTQKEPASAKKQCTAHCKCHGADLRISSWLTMQVMAP